MYDISAIGVSVRLIASLTFPVGFTITEFADDADPFALPAIVGVAYDSGGVTTSTITVPLTTALAVGLASSIRGRSPMLDGFGLIAFASLTPIIFVLIMGIVWP